jgi:gamma-butyrobetaine dioxygenase
VSAAAVVALGAAELAGDVVRVRLADGRGADLHRFALRDGCPCADCRHPLSGQRLFETPDVVPSARPLSVSLEDGRLAVDWADGHRSLYEAPWLAGEVEAVALGERPRRAPTLWGSELAARLPIESYEDVIADRAALQRWLARIAELGFAVLTGAPLEDGTVANVAELFGHVRVTNYGRTFDVAVRVDASNLADTSMALSLHTDNPYRVPAPTLQLLQCLASTVEGGETVLADGFRAAELLAEASPERASVLARLPIRYAYRDTEAELAADVPVLVLDPAGHVAAVHLNNRSKGVPAGAPETVAEWYEAYFELLALLYRADACVAFRLEPGDLVVFDNVRVLHARTGFSGDGERRLEGCYADRDGLLSALAILERGTHELG